MNPSLNEQINEILTSVIKKANFFEKITELKSSMRGFIFFSGFTTSFLLMNVFFNNFSSYSQFNNINHNIYTSFQKINENQKNFEIIIHTLTKKVDELIDINKKLLDLNSNKINNTINTNIEERNNEDDELLNECYDNIPCNNIKKATGINRLFGL